MFYFLKTDSGDVKQNGEMLKCDNRFGGSMPICYISSTLCCVLEQFF